MQARCCTPCQQFRLFSIFFFRRVYEIINAVLFYYSTYIIAWYGNTYFNFEIPVIPEVKQHEVPAFNLHIDFITYVVWDRFTIDSVTSREDCSNSSRDIYLVHRTTTKLHVQALLNV